MTKVQMMAGTLAANLQDRTLNGLLLKYGEVGRTNLGRIKVKRGAFAMPADIKSFLNLNLGHDAMKPVARALFAQDTDEGIFGTWRVEDTPEGNALLAQYDANDPAAPRKLSIEVDGIVIKDGEAIKGVIHGGAIVPAGAFPSSTLMAADVGELNVVEDPAVEQDPAASSEPVVTEEKFTDEYTDENGVTRSRTTTRTTTVDGDTTTITETTVIEEPAATQEEDPTVTLPNTLNAAKAGTIITKPKHDLGAIYAAVASLKSVAPSAAAHTLLAALSDITISGAGALPAAGVLQNNWLGQVWQGKTYERRYINLGKLGTEINAAGKKGFKIFRGTEADPKTTLGNTWNGNKSAVTSGTGYTKTIESTLRRFAFAADIAREFYDLPGGTEVVEAFIRLIVEDYATWSDQKALADIVTTAGAPIAPSAYPAQYNASIGQVIQGILTVKRANDIPSYAIVNETAMDQLLYTPKDLIPEFISLDFNTDGEGTADGKVSVVSAPDAFFTGIKANKPAAIVGAQNAIEFDEVSSTPIQIDALELAKGGVDRALHGYLQTLIVRPEAVVLVGEAAA
ncbi:hypothetical protein [Glaciibacter psychrotolerans]|uniref:Uncharacterized protein n=1 Tax=Glaciibacter psychrotolerans TaxID=670054 RepID=A0A7Z0J719_9MICO|nr:hypothetical protein [Leifsonia psychrotolerans]NYJ20811.1 hypothetical protein [Leifsonia psychrotolerans]